MQNLQLLFWVHHLLVSIIGSFLLLLYSGLLNTSLTNSIVLSSFHNAPYVIMPRIVDQLKRCWCFETVITMVRLYTSIGSWHCNTITTIGSWHLMQLPQSVMFERRLTLDLLTLRNARNRPLFYQNKSKKNMALLLQHRSLTLSKYD